jgi:hypothetical protein
VNLNNKYLLLPKEVKDSFYEDANKVFVGGRLRASDFENEFKGTMRGSDLSSEKALYLAMTVIPGPLPSIEQSLNPPRRL